MRSEADPLHTIPVVLVTSLQFSHCCIRNKPFFSVPSLQQLFKFTVDLEANKNQEMTGNDRIQLSFSYIAGAKRRKIFVEEQQ
jgi:hypothetical protein